MVKTFQKYWQLFWHFRKIYLMTDFEYRGNFLFWSFIAVLWTMINFFFMGVIASANNGIAGWSPREVQLLIAVYTMMDAFTWSVFYNNMSRYTARVFNGELNYLLTKPIHTQFMLMAERSDLSNVPRFIIGLVMTLITVQQLNITVSLSMIFLFISLFLSSLCILYLTWFIISTFSFYVDKLNNINEIVPTARRFFETPADIYTRLPLLLMSITLPFALLTTVPTNVLRGYVSTQTVVYSLGLTVILLIVSHVFFKFSIKRYAGIAN